MAQKILVTGASGFIAGHCILELIRHGHEVRGTIRDLSRAESLKGMLQKHEPRARDLELVAATLDDADSWVPAADGCDGIFHIASPVPTVQPKNPADVIEPAIAGTVNVLNAFLTEENFTLINHI